MWKERKAAVVSSPFYGASTLQCPKCHGFYLHQGNTTVYHRKEDEDWTTVIAQDGENVVATKFPSADTHNPSSRRQGLTVEFECENCTGTLTFAMQQHKGSTYLEWVS